MSKQKELQASNVPYTTPIIMEHDQEGEDVHHQDESASSSCLSLFCCFESSNHDGETATFLYQNQPGGDFINKDTWFMKRAKSLKEYSELVAGPKWKNFIRKFSSRRTKTTRANATTPFQYDLQSYALNFNDGDDHEDDDLLPRSFSTRFAPPSRSVRV